MAKASTAIRSGKAVRTLGGALLAALLLIGPGAGPAAAGAPDTCCICSSCLSGPANICVQATNCGLVCGQLNCADVQMAPGFCNTQPACPQFDVPAPAPAMAPYGLAVAAAVLTAFGLRGLRRRR